MSKSKFKILYVNGTACIGGAEISLLNLLEGIDREIFEPFVAVPSEGPLAKRLRALGLKVKMLKFREFSRFRWFSFLIATFKLASLIRKERVNLVHANSIYVAEGSLFAAKLARVPCICHVRDLVPVLGAGKVRMLAFRGMDKIIAISDAVKRDLVEKLNISEEKIIRIYNGVDTKKFHSRISGEGFRQEFDLGPKKLVGMVGRLSPEKGQEIFLRAGKQILKEFFDICFVIIGSSELGSKEFEQKIRNLAVELNIKDRVLFTGFREDLPQVMAALDIVVVPSVAEPFGRVIIEAMACGRPVVAYHSGAAPEIITPDSGILVKSQDENSLAEAIISLLKDKERCLGIAKASCRAVEQRFDILRNISETQSLYNKIGTPFLSI